MSSIIIRYNRGFVQGFLRISTGLCPHFFGQCPKKVRRKSEESAAKVRVNSE
ncbi:MULTISPECIES: hypothetical protein [Sphingobacterium]|uniref:hypothetical protein n=1 Tax=Sphingobacterium TaxID=28453 RepID=UPI00240DAD30|nr:hypothetical protein [Sphingobacterium sp. WM]WFB65216.1 hypothetical protein PZ892_08345 [Sphingobacterium sp. WM]